MSPNTELELLSKTNQILDLLTGGLDKENGLLYRVNRHERRLSTLERWRWYVAGFIVAVGVYLKVTKVL